MSTSTSKAETGNNALAAIQEQINRELANTDKTIPPVSGRNISTKGKVFTLPDGTVNPGPLHAVILDSRFFNMYYTANYDPQNPQPPVCFAIAKERDDLAPHEDSEEPQSPECESCPMNAWGSNPKGGKGKACRNTVRLAVAPSDADDETEPMILRVPPTSLAAWGKLVRNLQSMGLIPVQVVTEISFDQNAPYPSLQFKAAQAHDNLQLFWTLRDRAQAFLDASAVND